VRGSCDGSGERSKMGRGDVDHCGTRTGKEMGDTRASPPAPLSWVLEVRGTSKNRPNFLISHKARFLTFNVELGGPNILTCTACCGEFVTLNIPPMGLISG